MNQIEKLFYESLWNVINSGSVWNIEDCEGKVIDHARIQEVSKSDEIISFDIVYKNMDYKEPVQIEYHGDEEYLKHYRPDFVVVTCYREIIIEIDGYDSHSNKEQFIHDKKRDREFFNSCIPTIRFAGSEIFKDPVKCAKEGIEILVNNYFQHEVIARDRVAILEYMRETSRNTGEKK